MDLSTRWLGIQLQHPFVAGASPLSDTVDGARRLEDAGAAAIVLRSLFEEQIEQESLATTGAIENVADSYAEATDYFPDPADFRIGPHEYLAHLARVRDAVAIPVVASLNGTTPGGWLEHARLCAEAGASALELNLYEVPSDPEEGAADVEARSVQVVRLVREAVQIPIAVKISPFYTAPVHFARALQSAGADGLVLFNRFFEPDVDVEELRLDSRLELSTPAELRLRLRWLAILSGMTGLELAVTGGAHDALGAVKAVMCGARTVQMVSALLLHGTGLLQSVRSAFGEWLTEHEYDSLEQLRGSMNVVRGPDERAWGRANYVRLLQTWEP